MLTVTVERNDFAAIANRLETGAEVLVEMVANKALGGTQMRSPVDTGNLKNSYHLVRINRFVWELITMVAYSVFVEFGTVKMAARPHMTPSVEAQRPVLALGMAQLLAA